MPDTLSSAVSAVRQQHQINPVQPLVKPVERVVLGTPVQLWNGIEAVISGWSTCDCNRYQVSFFNRRLWRVQHQWIGRSRFEVVVTNETATAA